MVLGEVCTKRERERERERFFLVGGQDLTRAPYSLLQWPKQVVDRFDKAL